MSSTSLSSLSERLPLFEEEEEEEEDEEDPERSFLLRGGTWPGSGVGLLEVKGDMESGSKVADSVVLA